MPPASTSNRPAHRALVPVLVLLGLVVAAVGSLGAPLVPSVAAADAVSLASAQWTLTLTLLVGAVTTPVLGRLGDGPHRRRVVLTVLLVVLLGSILTTLPVGFGWLLLGRGLQGVGLGLTSLAIAVARDALPPARTQSAVATLSVTTVAGIGLGYPVAGILTEHFGLRVAYGAGAAVVALTVLLAAWVLPTGPRREAQPLDIASALLLGSGLAGVLLALSQAQAWGPLSARVLGLAPAGLLVLVVWARRELRAPHPLVELRLLRARPVLDADVTVLLGGVGMYLLLSSVARYVQTPVSTGYGLGASVFVAGLVLTPFSLLGFFAGRLVPALSRRTSPQTGLWLGCAIVLVATVVFAVARAELWQVFVAMGVAGFGVGCTFAAVPGIVVAGVPADQTGSAMGFNQVLRTIGFSAGSALTGVVLAASTAPGAAYPSAHGYQVTAWVGIAFLATTIAVSRTLAGGTRRDRPDIGVRRHPAPG